MNKYYYIDAAGKTQGPVDSDTLKQHGVTATTKVWREGMSQWKQALKVEELSADFSEDYNKRFMPGYADSDTMHEDTERIVAEEKPSEGMQVAAMGTPPPPPPCEKTARDSEGVQATAMGTPPPPPPPPTYNKAARDSEGVQVAIGEEELKQRHGCVTAWLWVSIVLTAFSILSNLIQQENLFVLGYILISAGINMTIYILLLRWKKVGLILYYGLSFLGTLFLICLIFVCTTWIKTHPIMPEEPPMILNAALIFVFICVFLVIFLFHWISRKKASDGKNFYENLGFPANSNPFSIFFHYFKK